MGPVCLDGPCVSVSALGPVGVSVMGPVGVSVMGPVSVSVMALWVCL